MGYVLGVFTGFVAAMLLVSINMPITIKEEDCIKAGLVVYKGSSCVSEEYAKEKFSKMIKSKD